VPEKALESVWPVTARSFSSWGAAMMGPGPARAWIAGA